MTHVFIFIFTVILYPALNYILQLCYYILSIVIRLISMMGAAASQTYNCIHRLYIQSIGWRLNYNLALIFPFSTSLHEEQFDNRFIIILIFIGILLTYIFIKKCQASPAVKLLNWLCLIFKHNFNNIISIFVLGIIFVFFCFSISFSELSILKSLFYVFVGIISLTFSLIISKLYNWSENFFIRTVQKSIFYGILFFVGNLLLIYFGGPPIGAVNIKSLFSVIHCDSDDENDEPDGEDLSAPGQDKFKIETIKDENNKEYYKVQGQIGKNVVHEIGEKIVKGVKQGIINIGPSIGVTAAGGTVGAAMVKSTQGLPPLQRLALIGGSVGVSTAASKVGLEGGKYLVNNIDIVETIKNSKHSDPNVDNIPSPSDSNFTINSPLEEEIPLLGLLNSILSLNVLELFLIIIIIVVLNNNYLRKLFIKQIKMLKVKYVPVKYVKIHNLVDKLTSFAHNDKFDKIIILVYLLLLLGIKLMNIYFITELNTNIDDFILVYNQFKKSHLLILVIPLGYRQSAVPSLPSVPSVSSERLSKYFLIFGEARLKT
jgi:hypothetical protein